MLRIEVGKGTVVIYVLKCGIVYNISSHELVELRTLVS